MGVGLEAFFGTENVAGVKLTDGQTIQLDEGRDFVVLAIGMRPDLALLEGKGFAMEKDGLVVDEHMRTNVENVWAAGDCCQYVSGIDRAPIGGKLATNAVPMAKVAALDMLERQIEYPGFYNGARNGCRRFAGGRHRLHRHAGQATRLPNGSALR